MTGLKKFTQTQRVFGALRSRGDRGVSAVDFMPPTIDGGPPIMRLAARIYELREEGHEIVNSDKRGPVDVYVLKPAAQGDALWTPTEAAMFGSEPHEPSEFCSPGCVHNEAA